MRLLTLLFAFYLAFLSSMTCADEETVCNDQTHTTVADASHTDCGTTQLGDWCSPLCQCRCCGGAVIPLPAAPALAHPLLPAWDAALRHAEVVVAASTREVEAVWQPPRA